MSDFYQLTNSTSDFKSRLNDVFDKLTSLEKQHDVHSKINSPLHVPDDETASSIQKNPTIPSHAITFKKRPIAAADDNDDIFTRPASKWKKYDLDDVNEHHLSNTGNQHALNDFLRTRVTQPDKSESEQKKQDDEQESLKPIFRRPTTKQIQADNKEKHNDDDDDKNDHFISFRVPAIPPKPVPTTKTSNDNEDEIVEYKLKSNRKRARGVLTTNEKKSTKLSTEIPQEKNAEDNDDDDEGGDDEDELFEP